MRYCCSELKEVGGQSRFVVTGVRWAESARRKKQRGLLEIEPSSKLSDKIIMTNNDNDSKRHMFEMCYSQRKRILNPIIDWSDDDVWEFLRYYGCKSNPLYQCGYKRIGCVGCPMSYCRKSEFDRYSKYKENYIRTFDRMLKHEFYEKKIPSWSCGEDVFEWCGHVNKCAVKTHPKSR